MKTDINHEIQEEILSYYGIGLTLKQIKNLLNKHPDFKEDIKYDGFDTCNREGFLDVLATDLLGEKYHWPLGINGSTYCNKFFKMFRKAAAKEGIKIIE
jgi:hypothetical protein